MQPSSFLDFLFTDIGSIGRLLTLLFALIFVGVIFWDIRRNQVKCLKCSFYAPKEAEICQKCGSNLHGDKK